MPTGKISNENLNSFFGEGESYGKGYKWEIPIFSLSLSTPPQYVTISARAENRNCIREQNKDKRINIWKSEYSSFPNTTYNETDNPIYIFILKTRDSEFYAGWFYAKEYSYDWFLVKDLCQPFFGDSTGYVEFQNPIQINKEIFSWPFIGLTHNKDFTPTYSKETSQKIFFGAPGVGKSHKLKSIYGNEEDVVRITFHPETDYSSFVGCYKPQTETNDEGSEIVYKFQGQSFTEAYIEAWRRFLTEVPRKDMFLVIEEINRGNCAQIFGDIFQLLDRNEDGYSDYSIKPDKDLSHYLKNEFADIGLTDSLNNIKIGLGEGQIMILPPNLHILATMNTSDQSLFPIDSAFKRRWDWIYMPIETKPRKEDGQAIERTIELRDNKGILKNSYDWGTFLERVNKRIFNITQSEDKQLGFWFIKPKNGNTISAKEFVSKVIFYLWNDIYKDYGEDATSIFNFSKEGNPDSKEKERHSFKQFTPHFQTIEVPLVEAFLKNLEVPSKPKNTSNTTETEKPQTQIEETPSPDADNN